jgi:hypothetical protein
VFFELSCLSIICRHQLDYLAGSPLYPQLIRQRSPIFASASWRFIPLNKSSQKGLTCMSETRALSHRRCKNEHDNLRSVISPELARCSISRMFSTPLPSAEILFNQHNRFEQEDF